MRLAWLYTANVFAPSRHASTMHGTTANGAWHVAGTPNASSKDDWLCISRPQARYKKDERIPARERVAFNSRISGTTATWRMSTFYSKAQRGWSYYPQRKGYNECFNNWYLTPSLFFTRRVIRTTCTRTHLRPGVSSSKLTQYRREKIDR